MTRIQTTWPFRNIGYEATAPDTRNHRCAFFENGQRLCLPRQRWSKHARSNKILVKTDISFVRHSLSNHLPWEGAFSSPGPEESQQRGFAWALSTSLSSKDHLQMIFSVFFFCLPLFLFSAPHQLHPFPSKNRVLLAYQPSLC